MNFQGELTDTAGNPLNGSYDMRFAIYDASSGRAKSWPSSVLYEEHLAVPVVKGLFTIQLGSSYEIDANVFNNGGDRYLQIWICATGTGCTTFDDLGRLPVSSSAYAQTLHLPAGSLAGWFWLVVTVLLVGGLAWVGRRRPGVGWLATAGVLALRPVANVLPLELAGGAFVAERFLVFPAALFVLAVC